MRVLIDTCVIIDALQSREPFKEDAQEIFLASANRLFDGFITANSVTDIYYIINRHTHSRTRSKKIINKLYNIFGVLDTTSMDCRKAVLSDVTDYEDAVMTEIAFRSDIDMIVTRNKKDFAHSVVKVCSPKEFLKLL